MRRRFPQPPDRREGPGRSWTAPATGLTLIAVVAVTTPITVADPAADGFQLKGQVVAGDGSARSVSSDFVLEGRIGAPDAEARGGSFVLSALKTARRGGGCMCFDLIFANGFESGDTSAWDGSN